jgi:hypothetical protein
VHVASNKRRGGVELQAAAVVPVVVELVLVDVGDVVDADLDGFERLLSERGAGRDGQQPHGDDKKHTQ